MELYFNKIGEGQPLIILHGLFGSSDNWQSHGKKLAEYFEVYLVDQRNHGRSEWSDDFSYEIMAEDLRELIEKESIEDFILMGHSMGGKTAMHYAQKYPDGLEKLVIVDMGIKSYPIHHDSILEGLKSLDLSKISARSEADEALSKHIDNFAIRQFLLKNLYWKEKGQLAWRINIPVLEKELGKIVGELPEKEVMIETLFMRGGQSNYILEKDYDSIRKVFPLAAFHNIEKAGHWIHAETPKEFINEVLGFCLR
jgi:pimeloyl-ACP methyl ester carboxylesterase